jgi:tetratricopeptide (TPR) repeat protein
MKAVVFVAALAVSGPALAAPRQAASPQAPAAPIDKVAEAYNQFLLGRHLEGIEDADGAAAAFKRVLELDPAASDAAAELASLYFQQGRLEEATAAGEQALKIEPDNRDAHRVLGMIYASMLDARRGRASREAGSAQRSENIRKAIEHLEQSIARPLGDADPNIRATLARLYVAGGSPDKAITLLRELVSQEPGWAEGPILLAEAFSAAGRSDEAITWLKEEAPANPRLYATLAETLERDRRWSEAAAAYAEAIERAPRNADLKTRYASALMNAGDRDSLTRARDTLNEVIDSGRSPDNRALYLLSQAQRRLGDASGAEQTARRLIVQTPRSPYGYYVLAEALEERRQYQAVVDALVPVIKDFRGRDAGESATGLSLLLPHLGFAYQEIGRFDEAIATFDEAYKLAPNDLAITAYRIQANMAAKRYGAAVDLARAARAERPDDVRLARLEAQALQKGGKADQAIALLQNVLNSHSDQPAVYVALAQIYGDSKRGADAVKLLEQARTKFPSDATITFELGAQLDKQKRFPEAVATFQQLVAKEPENAAALNYLGYMLADRGERLDESVRLLKRALELEPENGSFLDSLGWAYYKADQLTPALDNLQRAAGQLLNNSVVQDHYGDALFKVGRFDEAINAWNRALGGDGQDIDRGSIDKKIKTARQKLNQK